MCKAIGLYSREIGNAALSSSVSPRRRRYRHAIPWAMQLCITIKSRKRCNVSLCLRNIGEVASLRAEGVDHQPRSGFSANWQSCNVASYRTPPPAAPPLSALYARQRRTLRVCPTSQFLNFSRLHRFLNRYQLRLSIVQFNFYICYVSTFNSTLSQKTRLIAQTTKEDIAPPHQPQQ